MRGATMSSAPTNDHGRGIGSGRSAPEASDQDWGPVAADDARALIPDGEYTVICTGARRTWYPMFRREAIVLSAKVFDGPNTGTVLERYFPAGEKIGRGSNYYREWVIANQGIAPRRRERMPMKKFVGKLFRAQLATVVTGRDGAQLTGASYSKIARIIELLVTNEASQ